MARGEPSAKAAILTVGGGRGFVVKGQRARHLVITAAHCFIGRRRPRFPAAHPNASPQERTYHKFLGPLGVKPKVSAECLFCDPVNDLAVFSAPDGEMYPAQLEAYEELVEAAAIVRVGVLGGAGDGWWYSLDGRWARCPLEVTSSGRWVKVVGAKAGGESGTSGSPILRDDGHAVGLVSGGNNSLNPVLASALPLWLLTDLRVNLGAARGVCRQWIAERRAVRAFVEKGGA